jgi:hypothetical protein
MRRRAVARKSVTPLIGEGMVTRRVMAASHQVVFLKGIVEAHEGLAQVFAEKGGDLLLAAPADRKAELDELVADLCRELGVFPADEAGTSGEP